MRLQLPVDLMACRIRAYRYWQDIPIPSPIRERERIGVRCVCEGCVRKRQLAELRTVSGHSVFSKWAVDFRRLNLSDHDTRDPEFIPEQRGADGN